MNQRLLGRLWMPLLLTIALTPLPAFAAETDPPEEDLPTLQQTAQELPVLHQVEKQTRVPWYFLAAVNQYEMGVHWKKNREVANPSAIQIEVPVDKWSGPANPNVEDTNPLTISMFGGMGVDGNGDKVANRTDPFDELYTIAKFLGRYGSNEDDLRRALWEYYQDGIVVDRITGFARLFKQEGKLEIKGNVFPIPPRYNYSYRSTWGDARGWGGRRSHEGCDIFANTGTPVLSTAYGVVEVAGWNKFGGWRIGIRDLNNVYHYYAHLNGFEKGIKRGALVKPGDVIGYVGSSGYGRPGTSGKFAPHLHYGMYRETGNKEWAFDPTPHLRKWENEAKRKGKRK